MIRKAADQGAQIILLQELFLTPYFCQDQNPKYFEYALEAEGHTVLKHFSDLAKALNVVLPISFYERANTALFNSVMMIDADLKKVHKQKLRFMAHLLLQIPKG